MLTPQQVIALTLNLSKSQTLDIDNQLVGTLYHVHNIITDSLNILL